MSFNPNIYLIESSFIEIDEVVLKMLIPEKFKEKIIFKQFVFSDEEKCLIKDKGKGYSEFLMLKKCLETYDISEYFLKISGRYQILNFADLLKSTVTVLKSDIVIDYSFLFNKCSSIIFYIKKSVFLEHFMSNMEILDDKTGIYIERIFLLKLKLSKITKAKFKVRPIFPVFLKSGSHNSTYTNLKQFIINLIYKFP